jgi:hypothetical protein
MENFGISRKIFIIAHTNLANASSKLLLACLPTEAHLTLNRRNIPFVNHVKYLGVIFDKKYYIETAHRSD